MKQYQIINAYKNLELLSDNENLTEFDQWRIYKLRKKLRPHVDFQQERENFLREKYQEFSDEQGVLKNKEAEDYMRDMQDLAQLDVEIEKESKPQIKITKGITCKIMEALDAFIDFAEPME